MSQTIGQLLEDARTILQDKDSTAYRNPDSVLLDALNMGMQEAMRLRADLFAPLSYVIPSFDDTTLADTFPLDGMYYPGFVNYVVGRVGMQDSEYAVDGRAAAMLAMFATSMKGPQR